jgi:hypothetical protein
LDGPTNGDNLAFHGVQPVGVDPDPRPDERAGQAGGGSEGLAYGGGAGRLQHLGRVLAGPDGEMARVVAAGGELPEAPLSGQLPRGIGVGGDEDPRSSAVDEGRQSVGLRIGKGGAQWCDADVLAVAGEGDCQRVEKSLGDDRDGAGGQRTCSLGQALTNRPSA